MYSLTQIFEPKFISFVLLIKYITCDCGTPGISPNITVDYKNVSSIKSGVIIYIAKLVVEIEFKYRT
jgi:hypothetical protein